jgi:glucan phosphoethanolaminetransferase (alkaline phosphatase superfamily)
MSPDFPWMTPVADAILLLAGGVVVLILAWLLRGRIGWRVALWTYGFLAVISILYRFPSVDRRAWALLAAGVAMQLSRWIAPRMPAFGRMVRRTLPWVVVLVVAIGVGRHALLAWQERRGLAALPEADSGSPNVLLIILDTVRDLDLSVYGYDRPTTPFLERFAQRSVVFNHALTNAPWTSAITRLDLHRTRSPPAQRGLAFTAGQDSSRRSRGVRSAWVRDGGVCR